MGGEFTILDWAVLAAYFVGITAFGIWIARKTRTSGGYFLGDRKLPWWVMIGQSFGTGTHAENPVAQAGATYRLGFATIWYQWKNMLITPFYWLMAPWYRRSERTTIGEMMEDRYGRGMALLYTLFAMCYFVFNQGTMMKGAGKVISVATGGELVSANEVVLLMVGAFVLYSFFGGLIASAYTDFVQGFLIIIMSFMLIPAGLIEVGGFRGMRDNLAGPRVAEYTVQAKSQHAEDLHREQSRLDELVRRPDASGIVATAAQREIQEQEAKLEELKKKPPIIPGDEKGTAQFFDLYNRLSKIDAFTILMLTLNGFIGITAQPHTLSMNATGSTERAGRVGQTYGSFVKRFCTIGWAFTGLIVAAMVVQQGVCLRDGEAAFGHACLHLLGPGLTGLMVACILAANMSTCSNFMVNSGALFTRNFYSVYLRRDAKDRELLLVGRMSGLALTMLGVLFAFSVGQVLDAFMFNETIPAFLGIAMMGGILWKRANRYGAFAAVLASLGAYYAINWCRTGSLQLIYEWLAAPYGWATLIGVVVFVAVSLVTPPEKSDRIERFFDNMQRSTDREGLPEGHPKPLAAELGQDLILVDLPGWFTARRWRGFFLRYREDLVGFVLAWGAVGLLVLSAWGLMQLGR
jgi:Na+/proline symporter